MLMMGMVFVFPFNSNKTTYQNDKGTYQSDKDAYNSSKKTYNSSRSGIKGSIAGYEYSEPSDLDGIRIGFVPLVLPEGTQFRFSTQIQDFLGDNPINFFTAGNNNVVTSVITAEMYLKMDDHTTGIATTDPGTKTIVYKFIWLPQTSPNMVKFKLYWKVESDIVNPKTKRLYEDFGSTDMTLLFTDFSGGTYWATQKLGKSIKKRYYFGINKIKVEGYSFRGNFVTAQPNEVLRSFGELRGQDYLEAAEDLSVPAKTKPFPINEKFFKTETITAFSNGQPLIIKSFNQYVQERLRVVAGLSSVTDSSACRFDSVCWLGSGFSLQSLDDVTSLNFPVIDPISDSLTLDFKRESLFDDNNNRR